jgi:APA family basic amino acid/polyamine antiporter
VDGEYQTTLGLPPEEGGYANDPVLGLVENLGIGNEQLLRAMEIYVGVLAATILFIATNAGVIGASRITYSMATYRQIPEVFRRLHPKFKTPWLSIVLFGGIAPAIVMLPGDTTFIGTLYSFGATLSFTVAHAALVRIRMRPGPEAEEVAFRARPNMRVRGVDWPLFAVVGGLATGISWLVIVVQNPATRWAGLGWLVAGFVFYVVYRRRVVRRPLAETVRAPVLIAPAEGVEYTRLLVPVVEGLPSDEAMEVAARLASERRARIVAITVLEVPLHLPLDAELPDLEDRADVVLDEARAIGDSYGVDVITRIVRGRRAGRAIVDEAMRRNAEIVVMGASRRERRGKAIFGETVDFVLKHAPCRVMVAAARAAA